MAISHFIITQLSQDIISKIGLADIVLNQQYDIAMEQHLSFKRIPELEGYFVSDKIKFKAYDQALGKYGNEADINLIWKESNLANVPLSANIEELWIYGQEENLLSNFPINQATEFIEIVSLEGINNLKLNGQNILQGHRLTPSELFKAIYTAGANGGGFPYFVVGYKVGRGTTLEATEYTFTVNIEALAELVKIDDFNNPGPTVYTDGGTGYETVRHIAQFQITKGYQNAIAEVEIAIACPFLAASDPNLQSDVIVEVNGVETLYQADQTITASLQLDANGQGIIIIEHFIVKDGAETGTTTLTLKSINGDPAAISNIITDSLQSNFA